MKRVYLGLIGLMFMFVWIFPVHGSFKYEILWSNQFEFKYKSSSIHYTQDTLVVVFKSRFKDDGYFFNIYDECSGIQLNRDSFCFPENLIEESIEVFDGKLVYLTNSSETKDYTLNCVSLNFERLWTFSFSHDLDAKFFWSELSNDIVVVHLDNIIYVNDIKTGKFLCNFDAGIISGSSIWNGKILLKTNQLLFVDPYTQKPLWTYDIAKPGLVCHGIRNNFVLLSTANPKENHPTKALLLDAFTGKEVFSMKYTDKFFVADVGISDDKLGITCIDEESDTLRLDAFNLDSWTYIWSMYSSIRSNWIIYSEKSMYLFRFPCDYYLQKIDANTGDLDESGYLGFEEELSWRSFISPRNIVFQANRIYIIGCPVYLFCVIDESL